MLFCTWNGGGKLPDSDFELEASFPVWPYASCTVVATVTALKLL